jgi:hypothetical protein
MQTHIGFRQFIDIAPWVSESFKSSMRPPQKC